MKCKINGKNLSINVSLNFVCCLQKKMNILQGRYQETVQTVSRHLNNININIASWNIIQYRRETSISHIKIHTSAEILFERFSFQENRSSRRYRTPTTRPSMQQSLKNPTGWRKNYSFPRELSKAARSGREYPLSGFVAKIHWRKSAYSVRLQGSTPFEIRHPLHWPIFTPCHNSICLQLHNC